MQLKEVSEYTSFSLSTLESWEVDYPPSAALEFSSNQELLTEDLWSFGFFWPEVISKFSTIEQLYNALQDLHIQIQNIKEEFRSLTLPYPEFGIESNLNRGVSGSYFLIDEKGERRFILKPLDEDAGCLHSEGFATPFQMSPLRSNMPLYLSSMREVLASLIAETLGIGEVVPKTSLGIFESDQFHDFSMGISLDELSRYMELCGPVDKEKLCSVQEYVSNSKSLFEAMHEFQMNGLSDEEIANRFDQNQFEDANILLWTTYDTDGHMGNFLVYPKGVDEIGNEILGLKKIDNGLAFPDKNQQLRNNLSYLPNAKRELSESAKAKIAAIDIEKLASQFEKMGLESAIGALKIRIPILQELAKQPNITLKEIDRAMSKIGKKE
jgi:hypothetical protein